MASEMLASGRSPWPTRCKVIFIVSVVVTITGCGATKHPPPSEALQEALSNLSQPDGTLGRAHQLLVQECLREYGFEIPVDASQFRTGASLMGIAELFASEQNARELGYQETQRDSDGAYQEFVDALAPESQDLLQRALFGDEGDVESIELTGGTVMNRPSEGCVGRSDIELYGSVRNSLIVSNFPNEILAQSHGASADKVRILRAAVPTYRECMAAQGIETGEALSAARVALERFGTYRGAGELPREEEASLAALDYQCQSETGVVNSLDEQFYHTAHSWIAANDPQILEARRFQKDALARADVILREAD